MNLEIINTLIIASRVYLQHGELGQFRVDLGLVQPIESDMRTRSAVPISFMYMVLGAIG